MVYVKKKTRTAEMEMLKDKARSLYFSGLTTREVGDIIKKSHNWVAQVVKEVDGKKLSTD